MGKSFGKDIFTLYYPVATCSKLHACSCQGCIEIGALGAFARARGEAAQRGCEAVTSWCMFDQCLCRVVMCNLSWFQ